MMTPIAERVPVAIPEGLQFGQMSKGLNAILNIATHACGSAENITNVYCNVPAIQQIQQTHRKGMLAAFAAIREIGRYWYDALLPVEIDLIAASDSNKRFGQACAHLAARAETNRLANLIMAVADPTTLITRFNGGFTFDTASVEHQFDSVCNAIREEQWPNWGDIINACKAEAAIAFQEQKRAAGRVDIEKRLSELEKNTTPHERQGGVEEDYVTLDQMAAIVHRSKRTLEKKKLPEPDIEGGGGKPHEWLWSRIRPWLQTEFGRELPEIYPGHRSERN